MNALRRRLAVVEEALRIAWAQPVASAVTIIMVAGMCATVLLTTGRTVGAEQDVMSSIDSAGTRSIIFRADGDSGLNTNVLNRIAHLDGIEWAAAFGPAVDVQNVALPGATKVPLRSIWASSFEGLGVPETIAIPGRTAWASPTALRKLGMRDGFGGAISTTGTDFAIADKLAVPEYLQFLEPLVIAPQESSTSAPEPVSVLVVIAARPDLVTPVARATQSLLAVDDSTKVKISTSEDLATLRGLVEGKLSSYGRNLVIVIFALTAALVAAILYGLVIMRRKDFGRRRALGASQVLIVGLLLTQTGALSLLGGVLGSTAAAFGLAATGDPLPAFSFFVAIVLLAISVGVTAALVPALAAARRDPLRELRVP